MSIEKLEEIRDDFIKNDIGHTEEDMMHIGFFMEHTIITLKDQQDQIADLRKQIAKTEIDYSDIKIGGTD